MTATRFLSSFLILFTIACAENDPPQPPEPPGTARFAQATDEQRTLAIMGATGEGSALAFATLFMTELDALQEDCPVRAVDGSVVTYDAGDGCVTSAGATYVGRLIATNAPTFFGQPEYDPARPTTVLFDSFSQSDADGKLVFDGTISQSAPDAAGRIRTETELTFDLGFALTLDLAMDCLDTACTIAEGSNGAVDGVGTFAIRGELAAKPLGLDGWVELEGEDLMRVEFVEGEACSPVTVDDATVAEVCHDPADPVPGDDLEITGAGYGCGDTLYVEAVVSGLASQVAVELTDPSTGALETHDLVATGSDPYTGGTIWSSDIVPGIDTGFECSQLPSLDVTLRATDADGGSACYALQGNACSAI
jgi:hypothetical protein